MGYSFENCAGLLKWKIREFFYSEMKKSVLEYFILYKTIFICKNLIVGSVK